MKKITIFLLSLLLAIPAMAVNITSGTKLYLKLNSGVFVSGLNDERYAAFFYGDGDVWANMTRVEGEVNLVYEVTTPGTGKKFTNVIFVRMNGSTSANNWDNKWNQTGDLTYDGTNNCFTPTDWNGVTTTWSTYTPPVISVPTITSFTATPSTILLGGNVTLTSEITNSEDEVVYTVNGETITSPWTPEAAGNYTITASLTGAADKTANVTVMEIEVPTYYEGEIVAYFVNTDSWSNTVKAYVWDANDNNNHSWPGEACTHLGNNLWMWKGTGSFASTAPAYIIFNNKESDSGSQTNDLTFTNGGVYIADGTMIGTIDATPVVVPTVTLGGDTEVYIGDEVTYTANALNGAGLTVAFYVDGTKQTIGVDGNTFTFTAPATNYTVQAKLLDGETVKAESDVLNVTVKEHVYVTFTVTVPAGTENVNIAGNFNGWSTTATPMTNQGNNVFTATIQDIDIENVKYKYVTNQSWDNEEVTAEEDAVADRSYSENDVVTKWKGIDSIYYNENIKSEKVYYLDISKDLGDGQTWADSDAWFAAYFFNKNTDAYTWVEGQVAGTSVLFYLAAGNVPTRSGGDPVYTHVIFCRMNPNPEYDTMQWDVYEGEELKEDHVWNQTGDLTYDTTLSNVYQLTGWDTAEQLAEIPSAIESVELADGIRYAYGVVEAEGAIEVYNVNGAVVARGNDNIDLRGLNRGIYIVRNGDQVRKVVR